jgi:hypothetical protein
VGLGKFHFWDKVQSVGLGKASPLTANLVPLVEFPYSTLVVMMDAYVPYLSYLYFLYEFEDLKMKSTPCISHTYSSTIASKLFNYKQTLQCLDIEQFRQHHPKC